MDPRARIDAAIRRGVAFLEQRQLPTGELRVLAAGKPDPSIFPTALAAHSLSFAPGATKIRDRAIDFLAAEMAPRGLWKHWPRAHPYAHQLPPDLDDTSCASAALLSDERPFPDNRALLLRNRDRRGLFRTWLLTRAHLRHPLTTAAFFTRTSAKPFDVDAVVNANVLLYLGRRKETEPVIAHLLDILRTGRETTCDKWYERPFAVWYFFSRALRSAGAAEGEIIIERIGTAVPANPLEHALAACARLDWSHTPDLAPLLAAQLPSGGWPSAGLYHGGRKRLSRDAFAPPHPDTPWWGSEELTTAFCIEALSRVQS